jgi:hypothetical protein
MSGTDFSKAPDWSPDGPVTILVEPQLGENCQAMPDAVVVVVSRDGGMRFVRRHNRAVTYWDQIATGPWEV